MVTPESLANEIGLTLEEFVMVKGVEFAKYTDSTGDTRYHLVYPDGHVNTMSLAEVYSEGNLTKARTRKGDMEVMVDDDGIHEHWDE